MESTASQALATLIASGSLTPAQIEQIESQLRGTSPWQDKGRTNNGVRDSHPRKDKSNRGNSSPNRSKDNRRSPTSNDGSPVFRSALLEEFRTSKNRKYDLRVFAY
jgi:hypothetical protein